MFLHKNAITQETSPRVLNAREFLLKNPVYVYGDGSTNVTEIIPRINIDPENIQHGFFRLEHYGDTLEFSYLVKAGVSTFGIENSNDSSEYDEFQLPYPDTIISAVLQLIKEDGVYTVSTKRLYIDTLDIDLRDVIPYANLYCNYPVVERSTKSPVAGFDCCTGSAFSALIGSQPSLEKLLNAIAYAVVPFLTTGNNSDLQPKHHLLNLISHHYGYDYTEPQDRDDHFYGFCKIWELLEAKFDPDKHTPQSFYKSLYQRVDKLDNYGDRYDHDEDDNDDY